MGTVSPRFFGELLLQLGPRLNGSARATSVMTSKVRKPAR